MQGQRSFVLGSCLSHEVCDLTPQNRCTKMRQQLQGEGRNARNRGASCYAINKILQCLLPQSCRLGTLSLAAFPANPSPKQAPCGTGVSTHTLNTRQGLSHTQSHPATPAPLGAPPLPGHSKPLQNPLSPSSQIANSRGQHPSLQVWQQLHSQHS